MKWRNWVLTPTIASVLFLAACGTTETDDVPEKKENNSATQQDSKTTDGATNNGDTKTNGDEPTSSDDSSEDKIRLLEAPLTYELDGVEKEETAFLQSSDNQPFSLYVLPSFELTAEEPYKDAVFLSEDSGQFMRIETLPADSDMTFVLDTMKQQLAATNEQVDAYTSSTHEDWLPSDSSYVAENGEAKVIGIVDEERKVKITIFTTPDDTWTDAMLHMSKTIEVTE